MPEVKPPEIEPMPGVDIGKLFLATAENAAHLTGRMQSVIAQYCEYQVAPKLVVKGGINIKPEDLKL